MDFRQIGQVWQLAEGMNVLIAIDCGSSRYLNLLKFPRFQVTRPNQRNSAPKSALPQEIRGRHGRYTATSANRNTLSQKRCQE
jgi:hypothetical protein